MDEADQLGEASGAPARLSTLATASACLAVLGLVGGCSSLALAIGVAPLAGAGVAAAPVLGLIGAVLGFLSLRQVEQSDGRIVGRPLGVAGLFAGLLSATVFGFMVMAALLALSGSKPLAPAAADLVAAAQQGQPARARELLSAPASEDLTAPRLAAFGGLCSKRAGRVVGSDAGFGLMFEARRIAARAPGQSSMSLSDAPRPVWVEFENQRCFVYVFVNQEALQQKDVRIDDLLVFVGVNEVVALREFGPAQMLADEMGWALVD